MTSATPAWAFQDRLLEHYPQAGARRAYLGLVVLITVALYYALYVGGGVTPALHGRTPYEFSLPCHLAGDR